jgi:trans-AT polyketide synthase/acyltransferase/oxidoreductase domain-containing protein
MVNQLVAPVKWTDSVRYMISEGCVDFVELGPGQVLTKLVAKIKAELRKVEAVKTAMEWEKRKGRLSI